MTEHRRLLAALALVSFLVAAGCIDASGVGSGSELNSNPVTQGDVASTDHPSTVSESTDTETTDGTTPVNTPPASRASTTTTRAPATETPEETTAGGSSGATGGDGSDSSVASRTETPVNDCEAGGEGETADAENCPDTATPTTDGPVTPDEATCESESGDSRGAVESDERTCVTDHQMEVGRVFEDVVDVTGNVSNPTDATAHGVTVYVTLYDEDGEPFRTETAVTSGWYYANLGPDEETDFLARFDHVDPDRVAGYTVNAYAHDSPDDFDSNEEPVHGDVAMEVVLEQNGEGDLSLYAGVSLRTGEVAEHLELNVTAYGEDGGVLDARTICVEDVGGGGNESGETVVRDFHGAPVDEVEHVVIEVPGYTWEQTQ